MAEFANALQALQGNDEATQALLGRQSAEQAPLIAQAQKTAQQPLPAPPKEQKVPDAPADQTGQASQEWLTAMSVLSGVAGAFSRQHGTTALNAFAGAMNGYNEGNLQAADQHYKQWETASRAAVENNRAVREQYQDILDNRRLTQDQQLEQIKLVAAKYQDQLTYQAADAKNIVLISKIMESQEAASARVDKAAGALKEKKAKLDFVVKEATQAQNAYKAQYPLGGGAGTGSPDFGTWLKEQWPTVKKSLGLPPSYDGEEPDEGAGGELQDHPDAPAASPGSGDGRVNLSGPKTPEAPDGWYTVPKSQVKGALAAGYTLRN